MRQSAFRLLNFGELWIEVSPSDALIELAGERINAMEAHLLAPGEYGYRITASGYYPEAGNFYLDKREKKLLEIALVPRYQGAVALEFSREFESLYHEAQGVLATYGIRTDVNAPGALSFQIRIVPVTDVGGIKVVNVSITMSVKRGDELLLSKEATVRNVTQTQIEAKSRQAVSMLTRAFLTGEGAKRLFSKR